MATELHALLDKSGESRPYVLVGHSMGGLIAQFMLALYPDSVAGLVLIDSSPEPPPIDKMPAPMVEEFSQHIARVEGLQLEAFLSGFNERNQLNLNLGARPLVVLAAGKVGDTEEERALVAARLEAQRALTSISTNSAILVAHDSGHNIPHESPALVVRAVRAAVESARDGSMLDEASIGKGD